MSTRDIRTPDEIVVNVGRGETEADRKSGRRKGPLPGSKPDDGILTRRRSGLTLNFWDLGSHNQGTADAPLWADLDFTFAPAVPLNGGGVPTGTMVFDAAAFEALETQIFATSDLPNFDWKFRKLGYANAEKWGVDIYTGTNYDAEYLTKQIAAARAGSRFYENTFEGPVNGDNWIEGKGLVLKAAPANLSVIAQSAFIGFGNLHSIYTGAPEYKITAVRDPGAAAVPFAWGGSIDVFLVPRPVFIAGVEINLDAPFDSIFGLFFTIQSRDLWLDAAAVYAYWLAQFGAPAVGGLNFDWANAFGFPSPENELLDEYKFYSDAKYYTSSDHGVTMTPADPTTFPAVPMSGNWAMATLATSAPALETISAHYVTAPGTLLAVLRKAGQWFYVYSTETQDSATLIPQFGMIINRGS